MHTHAGMQMYIYHLGNAAVKTEALQVPTLGAHCPCSSNSPVQGEAKQQVQQVGAHTLLPKSAPTTSPTPTITHSQPHHSRPYSARPHTYKRSVLTEGPCHAYAAPAHTHASTLCSPRAACHPWPRSSAQQDARLVATLQWPHGTPPPHSAHPCRTWHP